MLEGPAHGVAGILLLLISTQSMAYAIAVTSSLPQIPARRSALAASKKSTVGYNYPLSRALQTSRHLPRIALSRACDATSLRLTDLRCRACASLTQNGDLQDLKGTALSHRKEAKAPWRTSMATDPRRRPAPPPPPPPPVSHAETPARSDSATPTSNAQSNTESPVAASQKEGGYKLKFCTVCASNNNR